MPHRSQPAAGTSSVASGASSVRWCPTSTVFRGFLPLGGKDNSPFRCDDAGQRIEVEASPTSRSLSTMADVVALPRPDTDEMVRVHCVFRDGFALAPQLIGAAAADDADQVSRIATYYEALLLFLHVHHEGEDEILWPRLLERCPSDSAVINLAADQHH